MHAVTGGNPLLVTEALAAAAPGAPATVRDPILSRLSGLRGRRAGAGGASAPEAALLTTARPGWTSSRPPEFSPSPATGCASGTSCCDFRAHYGPDAEGVRGAGLLYEDLAEPADRHNAAADGTVKIASAYAEGLARRA